MKSLNLAAALITLGLLGVPVVTLSQEHNQQKPESQLPHSQEDSRNMREMMGKPTFEQSVDGVIVQVWLKTQKEHKEMMSEQMGTDTTEGDKADYKMMCGGTSARSDKVGTGGKRGHSMMGMMREHGKSGKQSEAMEEGMMKSMMAGTHHVMVAVSDEETRKQIEDVEVALHMTSPSKTSFGLELMNMGTHSCGGLVLKEQGTYGITAFVQLEGKTHSAQFEYKVK